MPPIICRRLDETVSERKLFLRWRASEEEGSRLASGGSRVRISEVDCDS